MIAMVIRQVVGTGKNFCNFDHMKRSRMFMSKTLDNSTCDHDSQNADSLLALLEDSAEEYEYDDASIESEIEDMYDP